MLSLCPWLMDAHPLEGPWRAVEWSWPLPLLQQPQGRKPGRDKREGEGMKGLPPGGAERGLERVLNKHTTRDLASFPNFDFANLHFLTAIPSPSEAWPALLLQSHLSPAHTPPTHTHTPGAESPPGSMIKG